jgi:hypothetical protein
MANPVYIKFTGRLKSTAQEGILAEAQQVQDLSLKKDQQAINAELYSKVNAVGSQINTAVAGVYKYKKSVASLSEIYALTCDVGDVFNVTNDFTFEGKTYKAGTNVAVKTGFRAGTGSEAMLDPLGGITDLSAYSTKNDVAKAFANRFIVLGEKKALLAGVTLSPFKFEDSTSSDDIASYFNGTDAPTFDDLFNAIQSGAAVYEKYSVRNAIGGTVLSDEYGVRMLSFVSAYTNKEYSSTDLNSHIDTKEIQLENKDVRVTILKNSDGTYRASKVVSQQQNTLNRIAALEKLLTLA